MKFKLLRGTHQQRERMPGDQPCPACDGTKKQSTGRPCTDCLGTGFLHADVTYESRDPQKNIVESSTNLELRFGSEKFQYLDGLLAQAGNDATQDLRQQIEELQRENEALRAGLRISAKYDDGPNLEGMSVKELRKYAEAEGIDLGTANNKDEIIHTIESELSVR